MAIANLEADRLVTLNGSDNPLGLEPGDALEVTLDSLFRVWSTSSSKPLSGTPMLRVDVVAEPVTPIPQAGFALLRRFEGQAPVACVRFAWSPPATRIELVNPEDLLRDVTRRRALYRWTDTVRPRTGTPGYAVQKIAADGATRQPQFEAGAPAP